MTITQEEQKTHDCSNCIHKSVCIWYPWDGLECWNYTPNGMKNEAIILPPEPNLQHLPPPIPVDYPII